MKAQCEWDMKSNLPDIAFEPDSEMRLRVWIMTRVVDWRKRVWKATSSEKKVSVTTKENLQHQ